MSDKKEKNKSKKKKKPGRGLIICGFLLILLGVGLFILGGTLLINSKIFGASFLLPGIAVAVIGMVMKDFGFNARANSRKEENFESEKPKESVDTEKEDTEN